MSRIENRLRRQLHTASRWPARSGERAALARVTLDFIWAIEGIYWDEPEYAEVFDKLSNLYKAAVSHLSVSAELGGEG